MRTPDERNLLQFSSFAGLETNPASPRNRFCRVMTNVSGSNTPRTFVHVPSNELSHLGSIDSHTESSATELEKRPSKDGNVHHTDRDGTDQHNAEPESGRKKKGLSSANMELATITKKLFHIKLGSKRRSSDLPEEDESSCKGELSVDAVSSNMSTPVVSPRGETADRRTLGTSKVSAIGDSSNRSSQESCSSDARAKTSLEDERRSPRQSGSAFPGQSSTPPTTEPQRPCKTLSSEDCGRKRRGALKLVGRGVGEDGALGRRGSWKWPVRSGSGGGEGLSRKN